MKFDKKLAKMVFDDGMAALHDPSHPCHHFVDYQRRDPASEGFQLPEPFSGAKADLGILFIGLNPGWTPEEDFPEVSSGDAPVFDQFASFFEQRFGPDARKNRDRKPRFELKNGSWGASRFWSGIENFGREFLGEDFQLGTHAMITSAIHYKSKDGWLGNTSDDIKKARSHNYILTKKIIIGLGLRVIVPCGNEAINALLGAFEFSKAPSGSVMEDAGKTFSMRVSSSTTIPVCPTPHFSRRKKYLEKCAAKQIKNAL